MRTLRSTLLAVTFAVLPVAVLAITFSDVPSSYPHKEAIEKLSDKGVIGGNPDGTFKPRDPVNRAAMLKMLYLAAGKSVSVPSKSCFPDVPSDAWYAPYVCDAVSRGHVKGYTDGKFWPSRPVSRSEALKLTIAVLGIAEQNPGASAHLYTDVAAGDWFSSYVRTALATKILPMPGQDGKLFYPTWPLERGEAAAYIWRSLNTASSGSSSSAGTSTQSSGSTRSSRSSVSSAPADRILNMNIPFTDRQQFMEKKPVSYRFSVSSKVTVDITVDNTDSSGGITCRLYELDADGFSSRYYIGVQESGDCFIRATLAPGNYQLQLQPLTANTNYVVDVKTGAPTDGNDGFSEAKTLDIGRVRVEYLDGNDLMDFYSFRVVADAAVTEAGGKKMTVTTTASPEVGCSIFPMSDVDLYGFTGPECNAEYLFPAGTYVVVVRHPVPRAARNGYSLQVK